MYPGPDHPETSASGRSVWKNFSDAIFAPEQTFEDVGKRPVILLPLLVLLAHGQELDLRHIAVCPTRPLSASRPAPQSDVVRDRNV